MFDIIKLSRPLQAAILLVLVLAAYQPSLHNGFIWDDDMYVTRNTALQSLEGLTRIWAVRGATVQYYPMVFTGFWVENQLFGLDPAVFHFTNMALHGANAILVWLILLRLGVPWAWLAAALFAVHPVNVESVAWITERKNVMSGLFVLSSLLILIRLYLTDPEKTAPPGKTSTKRGQILYSVALLLFVLALLSKSVTCMMPVVFLILAWWKQKNLSLKTAAATIPFFVAGIAAGINTALMEKTLVGAQGPEWEIGVIERVLIAGRALWFYAYKLLWPAKLVFIYPQWRVDATVWWQYLFPAAVVILFLTLFAARNRIGKGPFAGAAIFTTALLPALGFINYYPMRYSFVADHFQYLATISLIALAVAGAYRLIGRYAGQARLPVLGLCAVLLLVLPVRTWQEQGKYKSLQFLWEETIKENPACWVAYNNLGIVFGNRGEIDRAVPFFQAALSIKPDDFDAANNLITVYKKTNAYDQAVAILQRLLVLRPDSGATICYNLACVYSLMGETATSVEYLKKAIERGFGLPGLLANDPDLENIRDTDYYNQALALVRQKRSNP